MTGSKVGLRQYCRTRALAVVVVKLAFGVLESLSSRMSPGVKVIVLVVLACLTL